MLSIGKLARVAKMTRAQLQDSEEAQKVVESVDDRLDIVASHDKLLEACQSVLDARDLARNMQSQAEACAERLYARVRGPLRSVSPSWHSQDRHIPLFVLILSVSIHSPIHAIARGRPPAATVDWRILEHGRSGRPLQPEGFHQS